MPGPPVPRGFPRDAATDFQAAAPIFPDMSKPDPIQTVPAPWRSFVLVCGKCSRKLDGGFGRKGKLELDEALRGALKKAGRRRELRVERTGCLGLCPKRAVTIAWAGRPGEVMVVPEGADASAVLVRLGPATAA